MALSARAALSNLSAASGGCRPGQGAHQGADSVPIELVWLTGSGEAACPVCGGRAAKPRLLAAPLPDGRTATLLRCPACGAGFFHPEPRPDYAAEPAGGGAALAFYLQQGAGIHAIIARFGAWLGAPPRRLLDIGCGFGFGLDFARRMLGWEVRGYDPSPAAAAGRAQLGLPIVPAEFRPETAEARYDIVLCSELLEHLPDPAGFLAALPRCMADDGVLLLTTPAIEAAQPDTPPGLLLPLLSLGYHLVLQSAESLAALLRRAGFAQVSVQRQGATLLAMAGLGPAPLPADSALPRAAYRGYLRAARAAVAPPGDLWLGLTARAFREAAIAAEDAEADALYAEFAAACRDRFGRDPTTPAAPAATDLAALAASEPLCGAGVLLHRGQQAVRRGTPRAEAEPLFHAAIAAADRLRAALNAIGSDDGDAEEVAREARSELLLGAAEQDAPDLPARLEALRPALATPPGRAERLLRRCFVTLVNRGHRDGARRLAGAVRASLAEPLAGAAAPLPDDALDALYCLGTLELQPGGEAARALEPLGALRRRCVAASHQGATGSARILLWPALEAETLALRVLGRAAEAERLARGIAASLGAAAPPPPHAFRPWS